MKYIVDIKGEIEGDYEIIGKYEDNAPTVEAVPLENTGLWTIITVTKDNHIYGTCSNCGYQTYVNSYCGNCGSRNRLPKDFEARYL